MHARMAQRTPVVVAVSIVLAGGALVVLWSEARQHRAATGEQLSGDTMGTTYRVTYHAAAASREWIKQQIERTLDAINRDLSNWDPESWVSRFNRRASTEPQRVPVHARRVVAACLQLARRTDGAVDPTLGRLIDLWGFGPRAVTGPPDAQAIAAALESCGHGKLTLLDDPPRLVKAHPGLALNTSAVAKGYAVDRIAATLDDEGIAHYLVSIGGDVRAKGHPPHERGWPVSIQKPAAQATDQQVEAGVLLRDQALATSGDYRRYLESGGRRYPHIIDPRTGRPVQNDLASVSVIAPTAAEADGLATACMVLGLEGAIRLIDDHARAEALFIRRIAAVGDEPGRFELHPTDGWPVAR